MRSIALVEQLRNKHREQRMQLDADTQVENAEKLCDRLLSLEQVQSAQHIAAYIAIRGEISLTPAMEKLAEAGKQLYLPILREEAMHFAPWKPGQKLQKKGFGLLEPEAPESSWRAAFQLDLVLAPLVVFDQHGNRIGQGGGFYDRTFAFKVVKQNPQPILLGVAHDSQRESAMPVQSWDVPLDFIATERALYQR